MKLYDLCRDQGDPRRRCAGKTCRCKGQYQFIVETTWRPPSGGQALDACPGCGATEAVDQPRVTTFAGCVACGTEHRLRGRLIPTLLWRLFGRHEGYNRPSMWFAKTYYKRGDMAAHMERVT